MQTHEARTQPEYVGDEERWPVGHAAPKLALDEIHANERKHDECAPIEPMGQYKWKAGHSFPRNSPATAPADASDVIEESRAPTPLRRKRTAAQRSCAAADR